MNKMWNLHAMRYYATLKRKEILICATNWMDLENIVLSEISQSLKVKYCRVPPTGGTYSHPNHRDRE